MIAVPKKYVRLVSWADLFSIILLVVMFFFFGFISTDSPISYIAFLYPVLLIISGYIILINKKCKLKYRKAVSIIYVGLGFAYLLFLFIFIFYFDYIFENDIIYYIYQILTSYFLSLFMLLLIVFSGFYLRRISK